MSDTMRRHYGLDAVSRSLRHFLLGKTFTMVTTFVLLFLLARLLTPSAYAAYVSLQAVVILIGRISGFGVQKVLLRYLPELRAAGNNLAAYRLLLHGTLLRAGLILLIVLGVALALPAVAHAFKLEVWLGLIPLYLAVGYLRLQNLWIATMLTSFLWQREAQYPIAISGLVKLAMILILSAQLDLSIVVVIELLGECLTLALLIAGWITRWRQDPARSEGSRTWWRENRRRALSFGGWGILQNQSGLLYGSAPNRLVAAHYLPAPEIALFGLVDNLINLVRRFMPTQLFIGLIRPVALARFSATRDFAQVAWMSNLAYRLNLSLLMLGLVLILSIGGPLFDALTAGKYPTAHWLVAGMLVLMITEGMRTLVELMTQAVERNRLLFLSNLIQSGSLLLAIPLVSHIGLWGLVLANLVGTSLANLVVIVRLRRAGLVFHLDVKRIVTIVAYGLVSALCGWWMQQLGIHFVAVSVTVTLLYALLFLWHPPFAPEERARLMRLARRRSPRSPGKAPEDQACLRLD